MTPDPEEPCYEPLAEKDIVEPYVAPKAAKLYGAVYAGCDVVGIVELKLGKVNGMVVDSVGSGSATSKKPVLAWPVTVK